MLETRGPDRTTPGGALLTINLAAIRANYRLLCQRVGPAVRCAAVVKANAYGLGADAIAPVLHDEGCREFFVASLDEGIALRSVLPDASIVILNGLARGSEPDCVAHCLVPVLNSLDQAFDWSSHLQRVGVDHDAVVQLDSGMNRLGLSSQDVETWMADPRRLRGITLRFVMSHLACADTPAHRANVLQLAKFTAISNRFAGAARSLSGSSGIFLGPDFHFDLVRPGAALYGVNPIPAGANPMQSVVRLFAPVIQVRDADPGDHVGYGWDTELMRPSRLATLAIGYADGIHRALTGRGQVYFDGVPLPILGRVSMDTITVDATSLETGRLLPGALVEVIGDHQPLDLIAEHMGTSGYEVLTSLGRRYERQYV